MQQTRDAEAPGLALRCMPVLHAVASALVQPSPPSVGRDAAFDAASAAA